ISHRTSHGIVASSSAINGRIRPHGRSWRQKYAVHGCSWSGIRRAVPAPIVEVSTDTACFGFRLIGSAAGASSISFTDYIFGGHRGLEQDTPHGPPRTPLPEM